MITGALEMTENPRLPLPSRFEDAQRSELFSSLWMILFLALEELESGEWSTVIGL